MTPAEVSYFLWILAGLAVVVFLGAWAIFAPRSFMSAHQKYVNDAN